MNVTESVIRVPAPADLQRWSEELARNPGSLTFLPLARAYRKQGQLDLALKLCLAGLEQHPTHVEGHALLALLYLESGDRAKAADEWATVLSLKPGNFEALRGMGFRYLEQGEAAKARQHLERAALIRPDDAVVQEALRLLRQRHEEPMSVKEPADTPSAPADPVAPPAVESAPEPAAPQPVAPAADVAPLLDEYEPWAADEPASTPPLQADSTAAAAASRPPTSDAARPTERSKTPAAELVPAIEPAADPGSLFDPILSEPPALGVLLLDRRGFRLAGELKADSGASADDVGALLGNAVEEAVRTAMHLELGAWRMLRIEADAAVVHVVPAGADALIVIAARRETPLGWLIRSAGVAASVAERYLEGAYGG